MLCNVFSLIAIPDLDIRDSPEIISFIIENSDVMLIGHLASKLTLTRSLGHTKKKEVPMRFWVT